MTGVSLVRLAAVLLLSACAVPLAQLTGFSDSFSAAREAALPLYDEVHEIRVSGAEASGPPFPVTLGAARLDGGGCADRYAGDPHTAARCLAFDAASLTIEGLVALRQDGDAVRALDLVDRAYAASTALVAASGGGALAIPAAEALRGLLEEALKLQDRLALLAKLRAAAPEVASLIDALEKDVPLVHALVREAYVARLTEAEAAFSAGGRVVYRAANGAAPPRSSAGTVAWRQLATRFAAANAAPEPSLEVGGRKLASLDTLLSGAGAPLSDAALVELDRGVVAMEQARLEFDRIAAEWRSFLKALIDYREMLGAAKDAWIVLSAASADPFSTGGGVEQAAASIAAVRRHARAIEIELK